MKNFKKYLIVILTLFFCSCGYRFEGKHNPLEEKGIRKIYITVLNNNSLRSGAEVPFTSAFVKAFSRGNKLKITSNEKDADATLEASIESIASVISGGTSVPSITTDTEARNKLGDMSIATEYVAKAIINVKFFKKDGGETIMSQTFERNRKFQGSNRYGKEGTTSVLINDSQYQLALNEIAKGIALDAYDTMLESF